MSSGLQHDASGRELGWGCLGVDPEVCPRCLQIPESSQALEMKRKEETGSVLDRRALTLQPDRGKNSALAFLGILGPTIWLMGGGLPAVRPWSVH